MERFITSLSCVVRRLAHAGLVLLLLCGTLYITGCPKCKPEYKPTTTQDDEEQSKHDRRQQQQNEWLEEIDNT